MPRKERTTVPTSVILTHEQKAFVKKIAEKENRSFSHQLRHVITQWVDFHSKKQEKNHGKESQEVSEGD